NLSVGISVAFGGLSLVAPIRSRLLNGGCCAVHCRFRRGRICSRRRRLRPEQAIQRGFGRGGLFGRRDICKQLCCPLRGRRPNGAAAVSNRASRGFRCRRSLGDPLFLLHPFCRLLCERNCFLRLLFRHARQLG